MSDIKQPPSIVLRKTEPADLEALFIHQVDDEAAFMAAFVNEKYNDKDAYIEKWHKLLADGANIRTIVVDDQVAGSVSTWMLGDEPNLAYGLGKEFWNRGIATNAVKQFLAISPQRPLYGRAAFDNVASASILTKCGFKKISEGTHYAFARKKEIVEFVFLLED